MPYVTSYDGTQLYYKQWGAGQPIVFVHGWPLNSDSWDSIANAFANKGYQTIAYDRRGFGRSDQPWNGYNYDSFAQDLNAITTQLNLTSVHLVGFSMGGGEVIRYASTVAPQNVKSISLIGSIIPFLLQQDDNPEGVPAEVFRNIQSEILAGRSDFFANFFPNFYGNGMLTKAVSEAVLEWTRSMTMHAGLKGILDCVEAFGFTDFRSELPRVQVPALVIHGIDDQVVPIAPSSRTAAALLPNARLIEVEGGHHGLLATHEALIIEALESHLAQIQ